MESRLNLVVNFRASSSTVSIRSSQFIVSLLTYHCASTSFLKTVFCWTCIGKTYRSHPRGLWIRLVTTDSIRPASIPHLSLRDISPGLDVEADQGTRLPQLGRRWGRQSASLTAPPREGCGRSLRPANGRSAFKDTMGTFSHYWVCCFPTVRDPRR